MHENLTILIVGNGGREHALYESIQQSPLVSRVLCARGNGGIPAENRRPIKESDLTGLVQLAKDEKVDLVVIGPERPLVAGLVNRLHKEGIAAFGPNKKPAMLEGSKTFAKVLCVKYRIPTASNQSSITNTWPEVSTSA